MLNSGKKKDFFSDALFVFLKWSHAVISVIFGILGQFGIGVGDPKNSDRKKFRRKKIEKDCRKNRKIFFETKKNSKKNHWKINENVKSKFWLFEKTSKILIFYWLFTRNLFSRTFPKLFSVLKNVRFCFEKILYNHNFIQESKNHT